MDCTIQVYKGDDIGRVSLIEKVPSDAELMVIFINPSGIIDSASYNMWQDNGGTIVVNSETCVYGITDYESFKQDAKATNLSEWFQYYDGEIYGCSDWDYLLKNRDEVEKPDELVIVVTAE